MGTIGGQSIFNDNGLEVGMFFPEGGDEPFGGIAFTIVFGCAILCVDHLGSKWKNDSAVGMNEGPGEHLVLIGGTPITMVFGTTGRTLDLFGGLRPRPVHGEQVIAAHDREIGKGLASLQRSVDRIERSSQCGRINRIQTFPQGGITRGPCNREEGLQIVGNDRVSLFTTGLFVKLQERGILEGKEGQTGHQAIRQAVLAITDRIRNGGKGRADGG